MSPLSPFSNTFYRFYIIDTIIYNGLEVIDLAFMPANQQDIGFKGDLYILNDTTYAVVKADLGISEKVNLNFVNDLELVQEFTRKDSVWILSKDKVIIDFSFSKKRSGFFSARSGIYQNHLFNKEQKASIYSGTENVIETKGADQQNDVFWETARPEELSKSEAGIYEMVDTLLEVPAFKTTMDIITLVLSGYKQFGKVEMGPVGAYIEHYFNGFFFNKIPLLKRLKFREVITFKGVWGNLSDKNNPDKNPNLIQFIRDENGQKQTFTLESKPYMEVSVGVMNIFKFLRIDAVKRLTYLENPDIPVLFGVEGMGIRAMIKFEF